MTLLPVPAPCFPGKEKTPTDVGDDDLLLSLKKNPQEFETKARLLLAVKLYEMGRVSTGIAAQLAVLDSTPIIALAWVGKLGLLQRLYGQIVIPPAGSLPAACWSSLHRLGSMQEATEM